jgi:hypothetical protein
MVATLCQSVHRTPFEVSFVKVPQARERNPHRTQKKLLHTDDMIKRATGEYR